VQRGNEAKTIFLPATTDPKDSVDIGIDLLSGVIYTNPSPLKQVSSAALKTVRTLVALVNPRVDLGISNLASPIGIISNFFDLAKEGMPFVLWFTILVNVNLAIFNLLPIPVLDGGHIMFALIAKLRGRALPADFIATTQSIFMVLLFSMIIYVGVFDVRRIVRDNTSEKPAPATAPAPTPALPPSAPAPAPATP
jgi:regulator of sigma E protease